MLSEASIAARVAATLKAMPDWFKATLLGGVLVLSAFGVMSFFGTANAGGCSPADMAATATRVQALELDARDTHNTLIRIENKIDQLLLQLIGD
jgi:hypothetical protein